MLHLAAAACTAQLPGRTERPGGPGTGTSWPGSSGSSQGGGDRLGADPGGGAYQGAAGGGRGDCLGLLLLDMGQGLPLRTSPPHPDLTLTLMHTGQQQRQQQQQQQQRQQQQQQEEGEGGRLACGPAAGLPPAALLFDACLSVSALQWLLHRPLQPDRALTSLLTQLHCALRPGARAVLQVYLRGRQEADRLLAAARAAGFCAPSPDQCDLRVKREHLRHARHLLRLLQRSAQLPQAAPGLLSPYCGEEEEVPPNKESSSRESNQRPMHDTEPRFDRDAGGHCNEGKGSGRRPGPAHRKLAAASQPRQKRLQHPGHQGEGLGGAAQQGQAWDESKGQHPGPPCEPAAAAAAAAGSASHPPVVLLRQVLGVQQPAPGTRNPGRGHGEEGQGHVGAGAWSFSAHVADNRLCACGGSTTVHLLLCPPPPAPLYLAAGEVAEAEAGEVVPSATCQRREQPGGKARGGGGALEEREGQGGQAEEVTSAVQAACLDFLCEALQVTPQQVGTAALLPPTPFPPYNVLHQVWHANCRHEAPAPTTLPPCPSATATAAALHGEEEMQAVCAAGSSLAGRGGEMAESRCDLPATLRLCAARVAYVVQAAVRARQSLVALHLTLALSPVSVETARAELLLGCFGSCTHTSQAEQIQALRAELLRCT
ncbi:hypothetical protein QJQ45_023167 [Haematococcus lacustris]|nr:hypothetical protein QJQ45_023167 [Haematococcus lacustris]